MADKEDVVARVRDLAAVVEELPEGPGRSGLRSEVNDLYEVIESVLGKAGQQVRPRGIFGPDNGTSNCCNTKVK